MRKILVSTFVSLDGVMQAPGGPGEDESGGFDQGGWTVKFWDDAMNQEMGRIFARKFDLLLGRRTYEIFASHWPYSKEEGADALNSATKYVASRTLTQKDLTWKHSTLLGDDVPAALRKLKQESGHDLLVYGSGNFVQTLVKHDLVDEFHTWTFPVLLGKGKKLFEDGLPAQKLELASSKTSTTGVTMALYRPAGSIELGSFALGEPSREEIARRKKHAKEG